MDRKHGRIHRDKYFSQGLPLKVAISLGQEPLLFLGSCMELPYGMSEYAYVGGWRGEPVEVVEGEFSGLPIPAHAEIVLEGECHPDIRMAGAARWTRLFQRAKRDLTHGRSLMPAAPMSG